MTSRMIIGLLLTLVILTPYPVLPNENPDGDGIEPEVRSYTQAYLTSLLGFLSEDRGLDEPADIFLYPPIECIDIYGDLEYYLYVYYKGENTPMEIESMKALGELYDGKIRSGHEYPGDYGYIIMSASDNPRLSFCQYNIPTVVYNYTLAEKKARELLNVDNVNCLGFVYKFKYAGLLFEGGNNKILISPGHFHIPEEAFVEGGRPWKYFLWEELEANIEEWDIGCIDDPEGGVNNEFGINPNVFNGRQYVELDTEADWFIHADIYGNLTYDVSSKVGSCAPISFARAFTYYSHEVLDEYCFSNNDNEGEGDSIESTVREKTKEHLTEALGALYEHRGIIVPEGITLHEPMRCINIYGELTHYMYVYHYSVNSNPMSIGDIKVLGEKNIGKDSVEFAYPDGYGYIIVTANENPHGSFHQYGLPPHFYNYSLAVKSAAELLGTEDVEFMGIVYKFKYWGLLFEGNNDKVLINPGHYNLDESAFEEGGMGWKFFMWEDIKPHIDEWDLGRRGVYDDEDATTNYPEPYEELSKTASRSAVMLDTDADWY
jgi:hypothetical protein